MGSTSQFKPGKVDICKPSYVKFYLREKFKLSTAEVENILDAVSVKFRDQWVKSNYSDYSIYTDPLYLFDMAHCYFRFSRASVSATRAKLPRIESILDYYNGIGLTTIQTQYLWPETTVHFFNDVEAQKDFMFGYLKRFHMPRDGIQQDEGGKYDAIFLFEVLEHMQEPEHFFVEKIHDRIRTYLVFASPFAEMWGGHFPAYHGTDSNRYKRVFKKFLNQLGYREIFKGFNDRPLIYQKGGTDAG